MDMKMGSGTAESGMDMKMGLGTDALAPVQQPAANPAIDHSSM